MKPNNSLNKPIFFNLGPLVSYSGVCPIYNTYFYCRTALRSCHRICKYSGIRTCRVHTGIDTLEHRWSRRSTTPRTLRSTPRRVSFSPKPTNITHFHQTVYDPHAIQIINIERYKKIDFNMNWFNVHY